MKASSGYKKIIKHLLFNVISGKKGYTDFKVLSGPAKGCKLRLDIRYEGSYWLGNYDKSIIHAVPFSRIIPAGAVVWDCGTYVGYYTCIFREIIGETGSVIAFEALSKTYDKVKFLPELNNWKNVKVLNLAIGPDHTVVKFVNNLGANNGPLNLGKIYKESRKCLETEHVKSCDVDELVYEIGIEAPDFIKFDLESGEEFALHNGDRLYKEKRPFILLELHGERAKHAAGLFFEKYQYAGILMQDMERQLKPIRSVNDFAKIEGVPHMIFCLPE